MRKTGQKNNKKLGELGRGARSQGNHDRERQNDSGRGMGALGGRGWEQNWIVELQFVKFTDKSWSFQQSLSVMGSAR